MTPEYLSLNTEIIDDLHAILDEAFDDMVEEQVQQLGEYLILLGAAFKEENAAVGMRLAHSLKTSVGQIGLQGVHWMAKDLELTLQADDEQNNPPSDKAKMLYREIKEALPHAQAAMQP